jgi:hypothetical protein
MPKTIHSLLLRLRAAPLVPRVDRRQFASVLAGALLAPAASSLVSAQAGSVPASGEELVRRMHDAYDGRWFRTVTFVQRTTMHPPGGQERVMTWYEAVQAPSRLRIDVGDPSEGNGVLFTADSTYRFRGGKLVGSVGEGNPFMPFVVALYAQPVERTLAEMAREHYDMSAVRTDTLDGRRVFVVGARSADDVTSPQFWVDAERLVTLRMIVSTPTDSGPRAVDARLRDWVAVGGGWLATVVDISINGALVQKEEYSDWHGDVPLSDALFDPAQWSTAPHWAAGRSDKR